MSSLNHSTLTHASEERTVSPAAHFSTTEEGDHEKQFTDQHILGPSVCVCLWRGWGLSSVKEKNFEVYAAMCLVFFFLIQYVVSGC